MVMSVLRTADVCPQARTNRMHVSAVSTHSNLERLITDSIGFGVLKRALR